MSDPSTWLRAGSTRLRSGAGSGTSKARNQACRIDLWVRATHPSKTAKGGATFYNRVGVVKTHFERPKDFGFYFVEDFGVFLFLSLLVKYGFLLFPVGTLLYIL